jgi:signal peptidase I
MRHAVDRSGAPAAVRHLSPLTAQPYREIETPEPEVVEPQPPFSWRAIVEVAQALVLAVVISVILNVFVVQVTEVRQRSMEPTLHQADRVLVSKVDYRLGPPQVGDIVVFNPTLESAIPYVKRVVAVEGDVIEIRDGQLVVNGKPSTIKEAQGLTQAQSPQIRYPHTVPPAHFFAVGDNRMSSSDSRSFGAQPNDRIIGKVILRFWPLDRTRFFEW